MIILPVAYGGVNHYNEGKKCVGSSVQVGDTVQTTKDKMTVVKLYGESIRCDHPDRPIRAKLESIE